MEDETQLLPPTGIEPISRPDSASTTASTSLPQLPGISALAAANAATASPPQLRASAAPSPAMYASASPAATSGGSGSSLVSLETNSYVILSAPLIRNRTPGPPKQRPTVGMSPEQTNAAEGTTDCRCIAWSHS
ncbi:hypothetical protein NM208_g14897 [Fusarium decemcellulare]|uniref:Uncharacterized protein n=1 Tax=Fusarium decemcellulare TaxID=57161 RepID=A0ACC1RH58_9HYPO|nr:hypothetical protein NM208_g14897 [Fusarium decemcellulare]